MVQFMRWIGILAFALAAGCGKKEAQVVKPQANLDTEVAVWVDQAGITSGQIQKEATRIFSHLPKNLSPEQVQVAQVRILQQAVDNLVVRQLVKAEMERSGILISQQEIEKGKQDLEQGLGEGHSLAMLIAEANLPMAELEDNLRLDLFKNKVLKDKLDAAVAEITDDYVRKYYDEHPEKFTVPGGRRASHILVQVPKDADEKTRAELRAKAEGIRKALLEGADFAKLASETSDCISRGRGGDLGLVPKGREAPAFEAAVYDLPIGEISGIVESPVGFHIIKPTGEQEQKLFTFDEVKDKLPALLKSEAQTKIAAEYIESLRQKATIKLDGALAAAVESSKKAAEAAAPAGEAPVTAPAAPAAP